MSGHSAFRSVLFAGLAVCGLVRGSCAQDRYFPLDHNAATGTIARWNAVIKPTSARQPQPVKFSLPTTGIVTFYNGSPDNQVPLAAPAQLSLLVGFAYRCKISDMPEYPGVELYPTIEILDRLHPPQGLADQYPIPFELTADEIAIAVQDRLVTKVIYLEQPNLAPPVSQTSAVRTEDLPPTDNLLQAADYRGRPMAILRVGGRIPDPHSTQDEFRSRSPLILTRPAASP